MLFQVSDYIRESPVELLFLLLSYCSLQISSLFLAALEFHMKQKWVSMQNVQKYSPSQGIFSFVNFNEIHLIRSMEMMGSTNAS